VTEHAEAAGPWDQGASGKDAARARTRAAGALEPESESAGEALRAPGALERWRRGRIATRLWLLRNALSAPRDFVERRALVRELAPALAGALRVDPRSGYARVAADELPGALAIVGRCRGRRSLMDARLPAIRAAKTGKFRLTFDLLSDAELARDAAWLRFALQEEVYGPAVRYLGTVPFLARIGLGLSVHLDSVPTIRNVL
jgi:hypothetical protein